MHFPMHGTGYIFALSSDWFIGLSVIGQNYDFGFGFTILMQLKITLKIS